MMMTLSCPTMCHEEVKCECAVTSYVTQQACNNSQFKHEERESDTFGVFDCALPLKKSGTDLRSMS